MPFLSGSFAVDVLGYAQLGIYAAALALAFFYVYRSGDRPLRRDSEIMNGIVTYIVRAAFYAVLMIGVVDMVISFLRVENLLPGVVGKDLAEQLGRPIYRGPYVHIPLICLALVIAAFKRDIGFVAHVSDMDVTPNIFTQATWGRKQGMMYPHQPHFSYWDDARGCGRLVLEK